MIKSNETGYYNHLINRINRLKLKPEKTLAMHTEAWKKYYKTDEDYNQNRKQKFLDDVGILLYYN